MSCQVSPQVDIILTTGFVRWRFGHGYSGLKTVYNGAGVAYLHLYQDTYNLDLYKDTYYLCVCLCVCIDFGSCTKSDEGLIDQQKAMYHLCRQKVLA